MVEAPARQAEHEDPGERHEDDGCLTHAAPFRRARLAHAALMRKDVVPPTPEHVAESLHKTYVKHKLLEPKYVETMEQFYKLSKAITHREIQYVTGQEYEKYYHDADEFVRRMKKLVEKGKF